MVLLQIKRKLIGDKLIAKKEYRSQSLLHSSSRLFEEYVNLYYCIIKRSYLFWLFIYKKYMHIFLYLLEEKKIQLR